MRNIDPTSKSENMRKKKIMQDKITCGIFQRCHVRVLGLQKKVHSLGACDLRTITLSILEFANASYSRAIYRQSCNHNVMHTHNDHSFFY